MRGTALRRNRGNWLLPLVTFLLLVLVTLATWHWQLRLETHAEELANNQESAAITAEIRDRLNLHGQFLRSLQAFATAAPMQDLATWRRFAKAMETEGSLSGMFAFAYAPVVHGTPQSHFKNRAKSRLTVAGCKFSLKPTPGWSCRLSLSHRSRQPLKP